MNVILIQSCFFINVLAMFYFSVNNIFSYFVLFILNNASLEILDYEYCFRIFLFEFYRKTIKLCAFSAHTVAIARSI